MMRLSEERSSRSHSLSLRSLGRVLSRTFSSAGRREANGTATSQETLASERPSFPSRSKSARLKRMFSRSSRREENMTQLSGEDFVNQMVGTSQPWLKTKSRSGQSSLASTFISSKSSRETVLSNESTLQSSASGRAPNLSIDQQLKKRMCDIGKMSEDISGLRLEYVSLLSSVKDVENLSEEQKEKKREIWKQLTALVKEARAIIAIDKEDPFVQPLIFSVLCASKGSIEQRIHLNRKANFPQEQEE